MKLLKLTLLSLVVCGCALAQCAGGGFAIVVNKANPTESISMPQLRKIMLGDIHAWPDHKPVILITRDGSTDVGKCILSTIVRMSDTEYHRYTMNVEFRGEEPVPSKKVDSSAAAARALASYPGGIAVVEASAVPSIAPTVKVLKVNGKEPGEAGYPL